MRFFKKSNWTKKVKLWLGQASNSGHGLVLLPRHQCYKINSKKWPQIKWIYLECMYIFPMLNIPLTSLVAPVQKSNSQERHGLDPAVKIPEEMTAHPVILPCNPNSMSLMGHSPLGQQKDKTQLSDWTPRTIIQAGSVIYMAGLVLHDHRHPERRRWCEQHQWTQTNIQLLYRKLMSDLRAVLEVLDKHKDFHHHHPGIGLSGNPAVDRSSNGAEL